MARLVRRLAANAPGDFFVDDACIACDTCRRIDPVTYGGAEDDTSFVARQPRTGAEELRALMALVACPVAAIGTSEKRFLFTGDHLWGDADGRLGASRSVCWYDWGEQTRSMERLLHHRFEWVLPGHGRPWRAANPEDARGALSALVAEMRRSRSS